MFKWDEVEVPICPLLCGRHTLEHVLSACKVAVTQCRLHMATQQVFQELIDIVDRAKDTAEKNPKPGSAGKLSNVNALDIPLTSLLGGANGRGGGGAADLPDRSNICSHKVYRNTTRHCSVLAQQTALNFSRTYGSI